MLLHRISSPRRAAVGTRSPANTNSSASGLDWPLVIKKGNRQAESPRNLPLRQKRRVPYSFSARPPVVKTAGNDSVRRLELTPSRLFWSPQIWPEEVIRTAVSRSDAATLSISSDRIPLVRSKCSVAAHCLPKLRWAVDPLSALWARLLEAAPVGAKNGSNVLSLPSLSVQKQRKCIVSILKLILAWWITLFVADDHSQHL